MSDKIFVNDLDLFMLSNYTKTYYVIKARVLFLFTWVHYTRRMSTGIVDPQPWSEIRTYIFPTLC